MEKPNKINPAIAALIVIVLVGVATAGVASISNSNESDVATSPASSRSTPNTASSSDTAYRDGEYTSQGSYITPGGRESIGLTVTLKDGVIEDVELDQQASGGDTVIYQRKFASGYKAEVVGKNIDEVELSRIAGSSLTSNGFNNALEQIKTDAAS